MEAAPYLGWRPSGTFARGGEEHDPRYGGLDFPYGEEPTGWLKKGLPGDDREVKSAGHVGGGGIRTRGVGAEEGPASASNFSASALSKAAEMIAAAGGDTAGGRTRIGGGTRAYPDQLMAGPTGITEFAPTRLRGRKREDELYG